MQTIFPIVYAGNIHYYSHLKNASSFVFDKHEHYIKQTYRNRCSIYGANGKLDLIIPVEKGSHGHRAVQDVKISYADHWQRMHWKSLESAYRSSPYFEYYEHEFIGFYEKKIEYLVEYNLLFQEKLVKLLDLEIKPAFTQKYEIANENFEDARVLGDPLNEIPEEKFNHYTQVFESKLGFIPNLSIIDLLVNCGPESLGIL